MKSTEKLKMAITVAVAALILLILVIMLIWDNKKSDSDGDISAVLVSDIASYSSSATSNDKSNQSSSSSTETEIDKESASSASSKASTETEKQTQSKTVSGNSFYPETSAVLKNVYKNVSYDINSQLSELLYYFNEGNSEAIEDLVGLERFEAMSYSLSGTTNFYYLGETNESGVPNGKGVAVYADNQYYYGDWVNGLRSGEGGWYQYYPEYNTYVVTCHQYVGEWSGDYPNGQGQEHFDYNAELMDEASFYVQNVIGNFSEGYYDGEIYLINVYKDGNTKEWYGNLVKGKFVAYGEANKKGQLPVLQARLNEEEYFWMESSLIEENGIDNIIYNGSMLVVK
ncbi:MAG: hypothetical protein K6A23_02490 [Butyrivibrio sp.]|nr:hypothetical protein [Butyrivibrio sp.]